MAKTYRVDWIDLDILAGKVGSGSSSDNHFHLLLGHSCRNMFSNLRNGRMAPGWQRVLPSFAQAPAPSRRLAALPNRSLCGAHGSSCWGESCGDLRLSGKGELVAYMIHHQGLDVEEAALEVEH